MKLPCNGLNYWSLLRRLLEIV